MPSSVISVTSVVADVVAVAADVNVEGRVITEDTENGNNRTVGHAVLRGQGR